MPRIASVRAFDGTERKIERLGLVRALEELKAILGGFRLDLGEGGRANGARILRDHICERLDRAGGWRRRGKGHLCWRKSLISNGARTCLGARLRVARRRDISRKELPIVDILDLRREIDSGDIDVGVLVVVTDRLARYLRGAGPGLSDTLAAAQRCGAADLPLVVLALEHDEPGPALPKSRTRRGRA